MSTFGIYQKISSDRFAIRLSSGGGWTAIMY